MISTRKKWLSIASAGVLALGLVACSDDGDNGDSNGNGDGNGTEELSGNIEIDGSSTVAPLSSAAAELFQGQHPGVQVAVGTSGTGGGFELFCNGDTDGSDASREIDAEEEEICQDNGIAYEGVQVANDAMTVMVHPDNPVECLTVEQLNAIWGPDSTITNWNDIPDLETDFDQSLDLFGPGTDSGTFDYFTLNINGEVGAQRQDYENIGEDDNAGLVGVQGSEGGMFYVGYSYYVENQDTVRALEIDGGNGCVAPGPDTAGDYIPLTRPLFVYFSDLALERPEVQEFADFYINQANAEIAEAANFIPMTADQAATSSDQVDSLIGG